MILQSVRLQAACLVTLHKCLQRCFFSSFFSIQKRRKKSKTDSSVTTDMEMDLESRGCFEKELEKEEYLLYNQFRANEESNS